jgi:CRP-like cAMP-binding protein
MELQGELCFTTCESFMRKISFECNSIVLSVRRCTSIDDGALNLLVRLNKEFLEVNKTIYITDYSHLDLFSLLQPSPAYLKFQELDEVLLFLENTILHNQGYSIKMEPVQLPDQQLLKGLTHKELCELKKHLIYECYEAGEIIINKGCAAENIYFLESGCVVIHDTSDDNRDFTLAVINSGNSFGEMALLDKQMRSANVTAQTRVSCFVMLFEKLDSAENLAMIKVKILTNLGASLSSRLRTANKEIAGFT